MALSITFGNRQTIQIGEGVKITFAYSITRSRAKVWVEAPENMKIIHIKKESEENIERCLIAEKNYLDKRNKKKTKEV